MPALFGLLYCKLKFTGFVDELHITPTKLDSGRYALADARSGGAMGFRKDGRDLLVMLTEIFRRGAQGYGFFNDGNWGDDDGE
ncbi:hypothetical protein D3Z47_13475 [Lachnospiraceae bacterium]|nr:hypothetical protein [Lachnospiraceae bacterium]